VIARTFVNGDSYTQAKVAPPAVPQKGYSSKGPGPRRRCLVAARRRLASKRAAFAARLGLVAFLFFRTASAAATTDCNRSVTSSRFRSWLRVPLDTSRSRPVESSLELSRCSS
jgi:hypothetical protein